MRLATARRSWDRRRPGGLWRRRHAAGGRRAGAPSPRRGADAPTPRADGDAARPKPAPRYRTASVRRRTTLRAAPGGARARPDRDAGPSSARRAVLAVTGERDGWLRVTASERDERRARLDPRLGGAARRRPTSGSASTARAAMARRCAAAAKVLRRFPVAVGRPGTETPLGRFAVTDLLLTRAPRLALRLLRRRALRPPDEAAAGLAGRRPPGDPRDAEPGDDRPGGLARLHAGPHGRHPGADAAGSARCPGRRGGLSERQLRLGKEAGGSAGGLPSVALSSCRRIVDTYRSDGPRRTDRVITRPTHQPPYPAAVRSGYDTSSAGRRERQRQHPRPARGGSPSSRAATFAASADRTHTSTVGPAPEIVAPRAPSDARLLDELHRPRIERRAPRLVQAVLEPARDEVEVAAGEAEHEQARRARR